MCSACQSLSLCSFLCQNKWQPVWVVLYVRVHSVRMFTCEATGVSEGTCIKILIVSEGLSLTMQGFTRRPGLLKQDTLALGSPSQILRRKPAANHKGGKK